MLKKLVLLTAATLLSTAAWSESYVYLTNNTDKTLSLNINQTGSSLSKGTHWRQHATSVAPFATVRYMDMNRDTGIKWGKSYQFDTTVSSPDGSTAVLQQHLKGTWNFSELKQALTQTPWYDDRNIHSAVQAFDGPSTNISFRAQSARVNGDDIYYVIQPQQASPQRGLSNNFKVLAYNVWALLPGIVSKDVSERLNLLQGKLNGYDAIVFSELFDNSRRETFLNGIKGEYPYQTSVVDRSGAIEDGGVLIVSRWPIETSSHTTFDECDAEDCLSAKGVKYARINKAGNKYHVFGSHTQAWNATENQATRLQQFYTMKSFMDSKSIPSSEPVIIAGDLNVDSINFQSEYGTMLSVLGAAEVSRNGQGYAHSYNGNINAWTDGAPENLDYVLYSTNHLQPTSSASQVIIPRSVHGDVFTKYDLSDHFAVQGELSFNTPAVDPDAGNIGELSVGGNWASSGGRNANAAGNPNFKLTLNTAATVELNLVSSVDTYLYLKDVNGNVVASDDDGGSGYNSNLVKTLTAGIYTLTAATYSTGQSGSFAMTTSHGGLLAQ